MSWRSLTATIAAGGRIGKIIRKEEYDAHGGSGQGDPIMIEVNSELGVKNQVAMDAVWK